MKLLKKEVFDLSKFTVVGSPTITSDGVASGFSSSDYITALVDTSNVVDNVTIYSRFTYTKVGKTVWAGQGNNFTPRILVSPTGNIMLYAYDGSQTGSATIVYDKINFAENEMIYAKCVISNAERIISVSSDGINWVEAKNTVALNLDLKTRLQKLYFGWISSAEYFIGGQIDLSSFKVFVDGQEIYNTLKPTYLMERRKEGFDLSKFTVVGSPTITDDGVASGFSINDYITTNVNINSSNFDIDFEFNLPNVSSGGQFAFRFNNNSNTRFVVSNAKIFMYDNTNLELCSYTYTNNYNVGDLINAKVKATSNGITLTLFNKTKNSTVTVSTNKTQNIEANLIVFGKSATTVATDVFKGSIDLPSFSITVDGKEVFTGAKEEYYMFK